MSHGEKGKRVEDSAEMSLAKQENAQLKKRVKELEAELLRLRSDMGMGKGGDENTKRWWIEGRKEILMSSKSYPSYLRSLVKSTSLWAFVKRGMSHIRRFRILSGILRAVTRIVIWAESGVAFIAWFSAMVVILPVFGLLSLISLFVALFRSRNANRYFEEALQGKKVYILFAAKKQLSAGGKKIRFFEGNVRDLASGENAVCFVVSPYSFRRKGLGGSDAYVTARHEGDNIYMVRKNYFFMLRRKIISRVAADIITIY